MKVTNSPNTASQLVKKKMRPLRIAATAAGGVIVIVGLVIFGFSLFISGNYAKDVAKPLDQALIGSGAVKKCEVGDGGRSLDNRQPWYKAYFELPAGREQTVIAINKIAEDNGYKLTQATPSNRGHLSVADVYLDAWYFDNTSKKSPHTDLRNGQVELAITVNANDADKACGSKVPITVDAAHSVISVEVELPSYK